MTLWETVLCTFLACLLATLLGGLHKIGAFRKRKPKEPPLDKGFLPWLGHGLSFIQSPEEFLERMRKKHGDIFTVLLRGSYMHFLIDPSTYESLMNVSKQMLGSNKFTSMVACNVFGLHSTESQLHRFKKISDKYLGGKYLPVLNQEMMEKLKSVMLLSQDSGEGKRSWRQEGVLHFIYKTVFQASFLTLFGNEPHKDVDSKENAKENELTQGGNLLENFQKFDHFFPHMVTGTLDPLRKKETERLKKYFWDILSVEKLYQRVGISNWVAELNQQLSEPGITEKTRTQFQLMLLWVSQTNIVHATFWILLYLLKYPEAMKAVREEVERVLRETGQEVEASGPFINVSLDMIKTPLLDSAIEETLRLKGSTFIFRTVMQEMDIKMADGKEYTFRRGDDLVLLPFLALQTDPEIHPDPHTFKYDRFVTPDGIKKEFYKNGNKLKYHSMPFGGGTGLCPGRFFAVYEMKMFVFLMLAYFDMELVNAEAEMPTIDVRSFGFGTIKPSHDIHFKYRLRV
ncbi:7-alpha-hydroxycholest-4-en-3-one 12-alpha-hydroxylase-like isoform X1 [Elgaria multicarinata webbii]|uniref:7-alpha-hydroxycholest-4-en-3-one 12-alpha-hydroxylase-like isoform X1 n=1 Tax=Elgaria multicarinata webbii TaxID=159646 RepID=UPI002FCD2CA4